MLDKNNPTDLLDEKRNSFGLHFPNHNFILGTKGDVQTFFVLLNDMINKGVLPDRYKTISYDLYRTLINGRNLQEFEEQTVLLKQEYSRISTKSIAWEKYPYNRNYGIYDYQQTCIDPTKSSLLNVFQKFFIAFEKTPFWVNRYLERGMKNFPRVIVAPTEVVSGLKYKDYLDQDFLDAADDPFWLREVG